MTAVALSMALLVYVLIGMALFCCFKMHLDVTGKQIVIGVFSWPLWGIRLWWLAFADRYLDRNSAQ